MLAVLPAAHRMRRSADFSTTVRQGVRTGRPRLVVHLLAGSAPAGARTATAGFVVSKAVGGAVVRNRVKRRLRHLMSARIAAVEPGWRVVVRALPAAAGADSSELARDLDDGLARATARIRGRSGSRGAR